MLYLGGPLKFHDLSYEEQVAAAAWWMAKKEKEGQLMTASPINIADIGFILKEAFGGEKKKAQAQTAQGITGADIFDKLGM